MSDFQLNLNNCDIEPIHIPGSIQSHGFLIAVDGDHNICFCSENTQTFIGEPALNLLGKPLKYLESLTNNVDHPDFITQLLTIGKRKNDFDDNNPYEVVISGVDFNLIISPSINHTLLDFEISAPLRSVNIQKMIFSSLSEILVDRTLKNLLKNATVQVKNIIQYDRVMIYQFAEDGHGEVVAESKNKDLEPWLGLHYPATDIPAQARELYKKNLIRLIADVEAPAARIITDKKNDQPLDLTYSELRAVSPIHIQYLKNMGVASSFSISLMYKNELWGLIACHNYTPKFIDYNSRKAAKLVGQVLSSALEFRQNEKNQKVSKKYSESLDKLSKLLMKHESIEQALTQHQTNLLSIVDASGAVLVYEDRITTMGVTPNEGQLKKLVRWIAHKRINFFYHTQQLSSVFAHSTEYKDLASGMMVCVLDRVRKEYIIWFKPEQIQKVQWAGDPKKPLLVNPADITQISPRQSFKIWEETVSGKSVAWSGEEINAVKLLKEEIQYSINLKARRVQELNQKLQLAYEELDAFSYTISHDLKNPLAAIKMYAQVLAKDATNNENQHKMLNRIVKGADKMDFMIREVLEYSKMGRAEIQYERIDAGSIILEIIKEMDSVYNGLTSKITLGKMPDVYGEQLMITQVFSNLIGNAIKYSQNTASSEIHIEGEVKGSTVCYSIKDNGIGISEHNLLKVFNLFQRMENVQDVEGTGVGLAIVKRIVDRHKGKIWVESVQGQGSIFFVSFNIPAAFQKEVSAKLVNA